MRRYFREVLEATRINLERVSSEYSEVVENLAKVYQKKKVASE
jgi:hypothetical protein